MIIGLTGKTGAGKSTVAQRLKKDGAYIVDGDKIARQITQKGSPVLYKLAEAFGGDIINSDGTLNRQLTAQRAFSSDENRAALNKITHSAIDEVFLSEIEKANFLGYKLIIFDAAALLESPSKKRCEKIVVVNAKKEIRLARILARDGITGQQAEERINAQKNDEFYLSNADFVFENNDKTEFEKSYCLLTEFLGI